MPTILSVNKRLGYSVIKDKTVITAKLHDIFVTMLSNCDITSK